jgi:hypothetical protein
MLNWYKILLHLLPPDFREEFGEEMVETFAQRLAETYPQGRLPLLQMWLEELLAFPGTLLEAYTAPQTPPGKEEPSNSGPLTQPWRELLLSMTVFLLPAGLLLSSRSTLSLTNAPGMMEALLFLGIMLCLGWMGGFPLWSMPYVSLILAVSVYLFVFQRIASQISPALISNFAPGPWDHSTYLVLQVAFNGMLWLMLFCLTLLAVTLLAAFNRFQPLLERLRYDWSLLSYILYGESVFALLLHHRQSELGYLLASLLCLVAGVWFFLSTSRPAGASPGQRLLTLLTCLTLAVSVSALQTWTTSDGSGENLLLLWGWMAAALLLPGLLARRSRSSPARPAAGM